MAEYNGRNTPTGYAPLNFVLVDTQDVTYNVTYYLFRLRENLQTLLVHTNFSEPTSGL